MSKQKIAVVGAGLMGHGIAQVFAAAAHEVTITDAVAQSLDTARSRIAGNLRDLGALQRKSSAGGVAAVGVEDVPGVEVGRLGGEEEERTR